MPRQIRSRFHQQTRRRSTGTRRNGLMAGTSSRFKRREHKTFGTFTYRNQRIDCNFRHDDKVRKAASITQMSPPPSALRPPPSTILIVDDEKHTRDGLRRLLENEYDVYVAADIAG